MIGKPTLTGMLLGYYLLCPRKAWLSQRGLWMEQESQAVQLGRLLDERSYQRASKQLDLEVELPEGTHLRGRIDWAELQQGVLHETKKGRACEEAHKWQLRFYLWLLKLCGVQAPGGGPFTGLLNYPRLRQTVAVELRPTEEQQLQQYLHQLHQLLLVSRPPARCTRRSFCKKCAFEELCYG
ncbi:MAG: CRISPR-associated protein Cas4 [Bacteroidetes bacterium]|nr:MAG: CRISPR-associated protein Cas4 [Bacteroidota bacterium]